MTNESAPPGVDTSVPSIARVYDFLLGGKDNFAVDRDVAAKLVGINADLAETVRGNRRWLRRVVRWLAGDVGIDQFLDVGSGLPTAENTHEIAQRVNPDARVVYVDNDPIVAAHGRALLDDNRQAFFAAGDLTRPDELLADPRVASHLELDRPVVLLQCATMHFVPEQDRAERIIRGYLDQMAPGSYLCITCGTIPERGDWERGDEGYDTLMQAVDTYASVSSDVTLRRRDQILAMFSGLDIVPPGLVPLEDWYPEGPSFGRPVLADAFVGAVAKKP